jgi:predicted TIM-barrel fold metal-dependent hydrolase
MIIDCHGQVGSGETWAEKVRWVDYKLEKVLDRAGAAGIDRTCIAAPQNADYRDKNRQIADLCQKDPDKLIGFAVHSPQREAGGLRAMLFEEVKSMGLKGVKSDGHPTREMLDIVAELKIPVMYTPESRDLLQSTAERAERRDYTLQAVRVDPPSTFFHMMATLYPSINFILPHLGSYRSLTWWAHINAIDTVKRYPNVYAGTSGVLSHKFLEMAAQELPADKLVFGTYTPELDPRVEIYAVKLLKLPALKEAQVLGGNIQKLIGL